MDEEMHEGKESSTDVVKSYKKTRKQDNKSRIGEHSVMRILTGSILFNTKKKGQFYKSIQHMIISTFGKDNYHTNFLSVCLVQLSIQAEDITVQVDQQRNKYVATILKILKIKKLTKQQ